MIILLKRPSAGEWHGCYSKKKEKCRLQVKIKRKEQNLFLEKHLKILFNQTHERLNMGEGWGSFNPRLFDVGHRNDC